MAGGRFLVYVIRRALRFVGIVDGEELHCPGVVCCVEIYRLDGAVGCMQLAIEIAVEAGSMPEVWASVTENVALESRVECIRECG